MNKWDFGVLHRRHLLNQAINTYFFLFVHSPFLALPPFPVPRALQSPAASRLPFPAPPLRCAAKAERVKRALRHRRCGGAGRRAAGALGGSGGRQAGRQAGRRSCRRVVVAVLAGEGGREWVTERVWGREGANGRASEQPAPSACSTSQATPPPPPPPPPRAEAGPSRAGSGPGHAAHRVLCAEGPLRGDLFPPGRRRLRTAQLPRAVWARVRHPRSREPGTLSGEWGLPPELALPPRGLTHSFCCWWGIGGWRGSRMAIPSPPPHPGGSWNRWLPPYAPSVGWGAGGESGEPDRRRTHCSLRSAWTVGRPAPPCGFLTPSLISRVWGVGVDLRRSRRSARVHTFCFPNQKYQFGSLWEMDVHLLFWRGLLPK